MIEVRNLTYAAGTKSLLRDISFDVRSGEVLAVVGANGAGKSTLLRLLSGELKAAEGTVKLKDKPVSDYSIAGMARVRAVLSQQTSLTMSFRVEELVMMGRYPHFESRPTLADKLIVEDVLHETGVSHLARREYNTLSGGEQQRVQLARVIAQIADVPGAVLLLDEPINGLDILYQQEILQVVRRLADTGYCVVCILHDMNFAAQYADRVLMLKEGRVIAQGRPREVLNEENMYEAFGVAVQVFEHPAFAFPLVLPLPRAYHQASIE
ncbi:heme ABC transporter ATP-binding protein [Arcticibacter sp. MXS-1]|uniref:heme ABC transporter ATP-binding protein n=1 Tax=Arcticibacter sp. MXS-1 TaxID=3341726 RepID=UPI0035A891FF